MHILGILKYRLPVWAWIPFGFLDWTAKAAVLLAVGYSSGLTIASAALSTLGALLVGLLMYQPLRQMTVVSYGVAYFLSIVAAKLLLGWISGGSEMRNGILLVERGHWTVDGAKEKLLMAFCESAISVIVLLALQAVLASRKGSP